MSANDMSVHSGNYYSTGARRVLAKLAEMGIAVPAAALAVPPHIGFGKPSAEFTRIEHAMLDWFEGRDFDQAQALIHCRPQSNEWHVIRLLDEEKTPRDVTHEMLCPSRLEALAAVLASCDRDALRLDACRKDGAAVVVVIGGTDALCLETAVMEPFDIERRDRVRAAFKGVRRYDHSAILSHAARLPGFKGVALGDDLLSPRAANGCMLLGFPGNWALAMRNALKQVDITVKQSQAQELAAIFFGASHWHQLVKHQDETVDALSPTAVTVEGQTRFYRTPEEAVFAVGKELEGFPERVVVQHFGLSLNSHHITFWAAKQSTMAALPPAERYLCPSCIESGANDYWDMAHNETVELAAAAQRLLATVDAGDGHVSTLGVLYDKPGRAALLEALLGRQGIPPSQIVTVGDYALAVSYDDDGSKRTACLHIYRITEEGPRKLKNGDVEMYKAQVRVINRVDGFKLVIRPDYGNDEPIEIPVAHVGQVKQLLALTHREDLFTLEPLGRFNEETSVLP